MKKLLGRLRRRLKRPRPGPLILLYHRVTRLPLDPLGLTVTPENFAAHLEAIRRDGWQPLPLAELVERVARGEKLPRALALTFDDGYTDNLHEAAPLLERYNTPATVFVVSGQVREGAPELWWDVLVALLLETPDLPPVLSLDIGGQLHTWQVTPQPDTTPDWHILDDGPRSPRQQAFTELLRMLRARPAAEREAALDTLAAWAGRPRPCRETHRLMHPDELQTLAGGGLVEIGAHTVSHPMLSVLDAAAQQDEIVRSRVELEAILGRPVTGFAYPFGMDGSYNEHSVQAVRAAGYAYACANRPGVLHSGGDFYQLPRFVVRDQQGPAFARRLGDWHRGKRR